jgi:predicted nucleotidyltransferase
MIQKKFAEQVVNAIRADQSVIGLAAAGSWLTNELDEYSDLDLILVTKEKVSDNKDKMMAYAARFGTLLNGFTGEHVGEPRVLICLYDDPLLHVDIKFLTLPEVHSLIELPAVLHDTDGQLQKAIDTAEAKFPYPDYQWIEDRFWTWIHYATLKIGRGEYFEAFDFFSALRMMALGPMVLMKNNSLPRGVRKVEMQLSPADFEKFQTTIPSYDRASLISTLEAAVNLYRDLRKDLFPSTIIVRTATEKSVLEYLTEIKAKG